MAAGDLTVLPNALQWLGLGYDPGYVARLISDVSTRIQGFLGYQVAEATYARTFNGSGGRVMMLPDRPIIAVSSVTVCGISVPPQALPTPGFSFSDKALYLSGWYEFHRGHQNIAVSYTAGYATVPYDIEQACLDWVSIAVQSMTLPLDMTLMRAGDQEYRRSAPVPGMLLTPPPAIAAVLEKYRRVS